MKVATLALALGAAQVVDADIYMHNPRGSNNRNCRTDNGKERRNANRLFDSQNNDNGGYSCPLAWPFACYKDAEDNEAFAACQAENAEPNKNMIDENGDLVNPKAVNTPTMYYHSGSKLTLEWTVQHGMGTNDEVHSEMIIQYSCEDLMQDNCDAVEGTEGECSSPFFPKEDASVCSLRDGRPVRVADGDNLNDEATTTITENPEDQDDGRYGRHETYAYYKECRLRERNKGLFAADQNIQGNDARGTRQNPNRQRYGFECPEESEYYPYWHHSPWKDVAIIAENTTKCGYYQQESQNVKPRGRCDCGGLCENDGSQPNNKVACEKEGYTWCEDPAHNIDPPACVQGSYTRQNHLGNTAGGTHSNQWNWTLPETDKEMKCVLRMRYNISTADFDAVSVLGTAANNDKASPLADNDENEAGGYLPISNIGVPESQAKLHFAVNTDQFGRTFQDRSYVFILKPRPTEGPCVGKDILNINVRGKRGNIVQAYPAVEYDFVPISAVVANTDCVHFQWTGTDYNPNRDGNNAEGGPYASNNQNQDTKSDRSNVAIMANPGDNIPDRNGDNYTMLDVGPEEYKRLLFLDQKIEDPDTCWTFDRLEEAYDNRAEREEHHQNCMKLSGAATPYFDLKPQAAGSVGRHTYMSTRNNNFSNRGQKANLIITEARVPYYIMGAAGGAAVLALGAALFMRRRSLRGGGAAPPMVPAKGAGGSGAAGSDKKAGLFAGGITSRIRGTPAAGGAGGAGGEDVVVAMHYHSASEPGELSFKKGDKIRVLSRDASGWWEGEANGDRGVFPANYAK